MSLQYTRSEILGHCLERDGPAIAGVLVYIWRRGELQAVGAGSEDGQGGRAVRWGAVRGGHEDRQCRQAVQAESKGGIHSHVGEGCSCDE